MMHFHFQKPRRIFIIIKALFVFLVIFVLNYISSSYSFILASQILFQDSFDNLDTNGTPVGWTELIGQNSWNVLNSEYIGSVLPSGSEILTMTGQSSWSDY